MAPEGVTGAATASASASVGVSAEVVGTKAISAVTLSGAMVVSAFSLSVSSVEVEVVVSVCFVVVSANKN